MGSKRVGDESEGRLSDAGDEPDSEGDFTAAVPSALVAGSSSGRRTWRLSMALSPQAQVRGRKRATVAAPRPGVTGGTCRPVNGVYNTGHGIWLMLIWRQHVARGEDIGRQLINFDIETL
jgi:hypothetical protein